MTAPLEAGATLAQARRTMTEALRNAGIETPDLDARILVAHALGLDRTALALAGTQVLTPREVDTLSRLTARRIAGEPVARILGQWEFWGLTLRLNADTLVPRPETETLVESALALVDTHSSRDAPLRIADLGTGTGALLLALLSELPNARGVATDISALAIEMAAANAAALGLHDRALFARGDFGAALAGGFDLVVSNPPYIMTGELADLPAEVRRDPARALDGGADGLSAYRAIADDARRLLRPGGHLVLELGLGQEPAVAALMRAAGLDVQPARPDLAGIPRAVAGRAPY